MTIGILGGGQLGYMLALAGYPLGCISGFWILRRKRRWAASPIESPPISTMSRHWRNFHMV